jgi:hypothetical protein
VFGSATRPVTAIQNFPETYLTGRRGGDAHRLTLRSVNGDVTLTGR